MTDVIETEGLTRTFGRVEAVRNLTLRVPSGCIFALLGPNGAGKSTVIKLLMNLLRPRSGVARVLGVPSTHLDPATRARIGYVSEDQQLPEWMRVEQLEAYCRPLYPTWDTGFARELRMQLDIDPRARIKHLSRGGRVKTALLVSLAYRPSLLVLDEPFSGLDPVVRDELIGSVLRLAEQEHWTVFLSSHDMEEVERLADHVAFLDHGGLVLAEPTERLFTRFKRVEVQHVAELSAPDGDNAATAVTIDPAWLGVEVGDRTLRFVDTAFDETSPGRLEARFPGAAIDASSMSMREIFLSLARATRSRQEAADPEGRR